MLRKLPKPNEFLHRLVRDVHQNPPRVAGVDHRGAEEISRSAGHREQRRGNQAAGRGFGDRDGLAPLDQPRRNLLGDRNQLFHLSSTPAEEFSE
jgi:hypothetical protein